MTVYIKVTIPALPESVRVSINICMPVSGCPLKTIARVRREADRRGVAAEYELSTREEYVAFRKAQREAIEAAHLARGCTCGYDATRDRFEAHTQACNLS